MESLSSSAQGQLRQMVEKLERLEEEKTELAETIREAFQEAKSAGFDVRVLRQVLKARKMRQDQLEEQEILFDVYRHALGMLPEAA